MIKLVLLLYWTTSVVRWQLLLYCGWLLLLSMMVLMLLMLLLLLLLHTCKWLLEIILKQLLVLLLLGRCLHDHPWTSVRGILEVAGAKLLELLLAASQCLAPQELLAGVDLLVWLCHRRGHLLGGEAALALRGLAPPGTQDDRVGAGVGEGCRLRAAIAAHHVVQLVVVKELLVLLLAHQAVHDLCVGGRGRLLLLGLHLMWLAWLLEGGEILGAVIKVVKD